MMSKCPEIYSTKKKEELYTIFSKGILLQQDKVLLSFNGKGDRNEFVSATMFTYVNSCAHKWRSLTESSFLPLIYKIIETHLAVLIGVCGHGFGVGKGLIINMVSEPEGFIPGKTTIASREFHVYSKWQTRNNRKKARVDKQESASKSRQARVDKQESASKSRQARVDKQESASKSRQARVDKQESTSKNRQARID
ncbi:hypothetical protein Tco_1390366 [Tanacetum coccineum]